MNDYFCVLPFYSQEYINNNKSIACCLLPQDINLEELRETMLSGKRSSACQKCWDLEDQGYPSDRQLKNQALDFYTDKDIGILEKECSAGNFSTQIVKLYTSSVCNSTCATCGPEASSAWSKLKNIPIKYDCLPDSIIDNIDYSSVKILSFVGGEPLYEQKNFTVLKNLIKENNTDCFISFVTNGSVPLSDNQISILAQFKNLNFSLSIDGVGRVFEYVRYPLSWELLNHNISIYKSLNINLSVSYTISNLNIFSYQETVEWFNSQGLEYNHNIVTFDEWFSPNSLPESVKDKLYAKFLLRPHQENDDVNFKRFVNEVRYQDRLKGISIRDYIPEVADIIDQNT